VRQQKQRSHHAIDVPNSRHHDESDLSTSGHGRNDGPQESANKAMRTIKQTFGKINGSGSSTEQKFGNHSGIRPILVEQNTGDVTAENGAKQDFGNTDEKK